MGGVYKINKHWLAWVIWSLVALFVLYQFLLQTSVSVMIPELSKAFQVSDEKIGFLSSVFFYSYLLLQIPSGLLIDRFGARSVLLICVLLTGVMAIWFSLTTSFLSALIARLIMGAFSAPAVAGAMYIVANWFRAEQFGLLAGLVEMIGMLGGALGEFFLSYFVDGVGWRHSMWIAGLLAFVLAVVMFVFVRNKPKDSRCDIEKGSSFDLAESMHQLQALDDLKKGAWQTLWEVVGVKQIWILGVFCGLTFALVSAFAGLWGVPFFQLLYHESKEVAALQSACVFVGAGCGAVLLGNLAHRYQKYRVVLIGATAICLVLVLCALYLQCSFMVMTLLLCGVGFFSGVYILPFSMISRHVPKFAHGTAMGFTNMMCILIGSPLLQPLIGFLIQDQALHQLHYSVHDYQVAFLVFPICLIVALCLIPWIRIPSTIQEAAYTGGHE